MSCAETVVIVLGGVTAGLQIVAVVLFVRAIRETRRTTVAIKQQSEATYVSPLWLKWGSTEIRESMDFALRLENKDARTVWSNAYNSNRFTADRYLEVARFFDDLIVNLIQLGSIREETALKNFGFNADHYWRRFEPLITVFRSDSTWGYRPFNNFEWFAGEAKEYLAKKDSKH